jgi:glycosyltransferase involved in cell wall biosynthesis
MIEHQQNGYLARPYEVDDLANGLRTILKHPDPERLREAARAKVEREFALEVIGRRILDLYADLLQR